MATSFICRSEYQRDILFWRRGGRHALLPLSISPGPLIAQLYPGLLHQNKEEQRAVDNKDEEPAPVKVVQQQVFPAQTMQIEHGQVGEILQQLQMPHIDAK